jgi:hypothetical protein
VVKRADARRFRDGFPELGPGRLEAPHIADDHNAEVVAVRKVRFGFTGAYLYKAALWCGPCTIKTLVVERKAAPGAIDMPPAEALLQIISVNGFTSGARRIDVANPLGESEKPITTWLYLP